MNRIIGYSSTGCIIGGSAILDNKKPFEEVANEGVADFFLSLGSGECVDQYESPSFHFFFKNFLTMVDDLLYIDQIVTHFVRYLQDQLIIFMALADGESKIKCGELTEHTTTAISIASRFTGV
jgi:RNA 3'-terminal phosphate cyclase (ATP)